MVMADTGNSTDSPEPVGTTVPADAVGSKPLEIGGRNGPEPTRYGDWEKDGRCVDF
ncbi:MAG TPA: hypothetical protein DDZ76_08410 [Xanthomonadales bacterium]|nr:hypothetical protein [Xanthomonadales bacterium]